MWQKLKSAFGCREVVVKQEAPTPVQPTPKQPNITEPVIELLRRLELDEWLVSLERDPASGTYVTGLTMTNTVTPELELILDIKKYHYTMNSTTTINLDWLTYDEYDAVKSTMLRRQKEITLNEKAKLDAVKREEFKIKLGVV